MTTIPNKPSRYYYIEICSSVWVKEDVRKDTIQQKEMIEIHNFYENYERALKAVNRIRDEFLEKRLSEGDLELAERIKKVGEYFYISDTTKVVKSYYSDRGDDERRLKEGNYFGSRHDAENFASNLRFIFGRFKDTEKKIQPEQETIEDKEPSEKATDGDNDWCSLIDEVALIREKIGRRLY